jgi:hypothetical protein
LCNIIRRVFPGESLSEESLAVPYHGYDSLLRGFPSRPPSLHAGGYPCEAVRRDAARSVGH